MYAPVPDDVLDYEEQDDSAEEESEPEVEVEETVKRKLDTTDTTTELDIPSADDFAQIFAEKRGERVASPRPLTPESNPPSPRKRPRTASWSPPEYVPDFLPPFPNHTPRQTPSPPLVSQPLPALDAHPIPVKIERPLTPPPELLQTVADYRTPVPYNMSLRASRGLSQLPVRPVTPPSKPPPQFKLPEVQPSLYQAYHHALTHPPPKELGPTNPARYRVAVTLIEQAQANPRWEPVPSLFAISAPNQPRVSSIGPVHPVPIADPVQEKNGKGKEAEVEPKWPVVGQRHISAAERVAPLVSQQGSRLPNLARQVLAVSSSFILQCTPLLTISYLQHNVISRTTRLFHPLALTQDNKKLTYGPGISAPWNTGTAAAAATTPTLPNGAKKEKEKDAPPKALPDARLYATWNWERKSFREPLPRRPSRMGTVQLSGTIGNGRRARSESHS